MKIKLISVSRKNINKPTECLKLCYNYNFLKYNKRKHIYIEKIYIIFKNTYII